MRRIDIYFLWCLIFLIALGSAVLCFVNSSDEFSYNEAYYSLFIENEDNKIDSEESDSDFTFATLIDFEAQNWYLRASHSSEFDRSIFSVSTPRSAIFSPLLI